MTYLKSVKAIHQNKVKFSAFKVTCFLFKKKVSSTQVQFYLCFLKVI